MPARASARLATPIAAIPASVRVFCRLLDKITATAKATAHIPNPSALAKVRRTVADAYPDGPLSIANELVTALALAQSCGAVCSRRRAWTTRRLCRPLCCNTCAPQSLQVSCCAPCCLAEAALQCGIAARCTEVTAAHLNDHAMPCAGRLCKPARDRQHCKPPLPLPSPLSHRPSLVCPRPAAAHHATESRR